jgi:hypothetical protein
MLVRDAKTAKTLKLPWLPLAAFALLLNLNDAIKL